MAGDVSGIAVTTALWAVLLATLYLVTRRAVGLLITLLAHNKKLRLHVGTLGFCSANWLQLDIATGPVASVRVRRVSLNDSTDLLTLLRSIATGLMSLQWQLPVKVSGLDVHLRSLALPQRHMRSRSGGSHARSSSGGGHARSSSGTWLGWQLGTHGEAGEGAGPAAAAAPVPSATPAVAKGLSRNVLRLLLSAIPLVPVDIEDVVMHHQDTGLLAQLPSIQLQLAGSGITRRLRVQLQLPRLNMALLPPRALPPAHTASGEARQKAPLANEATPLLASTGVRASVRLLFESGAERTRLSCNAASIDVGDTCVTLSHAALAAASTLAAALRQLRRAHVAAGAAAEPAPAPRAEPEPRSLVAAVAKLPAEISARLPLLHIVTVQPLDGSSLPRLPPLSLEARGSVLRMRKPAQHWRGTLFQRGGRAGPSPLVELCLGLQAAVARAGAPVPPLAGGAFCLNERGGGEALVASWEQAMARVRVGARRPTGDEGSSRSIGGPLSLCTVEVVGQLGGCDAAADCGALWGVSRGWRDAWVAAAPPAPAGVVDGGVAGAETGGGDAALGTGQSGTAGGEDPARPLRRMPLRFKEQVGMVARADLLHGAQLVLLGLHPDGGGGKGDGPGRLQAFAGPASVCAGHHQAAPAGFLDPCCPPDIAAELAAAGEDFAAAAPSSPTVTADSAMPRSDSSAAWTDAASSFGGVTRPRSGSVLAGDGLWHSRRHSTGLEVYRLHSRAGSVVSGYAATGSGGPVHSHGGSVLSMAGDTTPWRGSLSGEAGASGFSGRASTAAPAPQSPRCSLDSAATVRLLDELRGQERLTLVARVWARELVVTMQQPEPGGGAVESAARPGFFAAAAATPAASPRAADGVGGTASPRGGGSTAPTSRVQSPMRGGVGVAGGKALLRCGVFEVEVVQEEEGDLADGACALESLEVVLSRQGLQLLAAAVLAARPPAQPQPRRAREHESDSGAAPNKALVAAGASRLRLVSGELFNFSCKLLTEQLALPPAAPSDGGAGSNPQEEAQAAAAAGTTVSCMTVPRFALRAHMPERSVVCCLDSADWTHTEADADGRALPAAGHKVLSMGSTDIELLLPGADGDAAAVPAGGPPYLAVDGSIMGDVALDPIFALLRGADVLAELRHTLRAGPPSTAAAAAAASVVAGSAAGAYPGAVGGQATAQHPDPSQAGASAGVNASKAGGRAARVAVEVTVRLADSSLGFAAAPDARYCLTWGGMEAGTAQRGAELIHAAITVNDHTVARCSQVSVHVTPPGAVGDANQNSSAADGACGLQSPFDTGRPPAAGPRLSAAYMRAGLPSWAQPGGSATRRVRVVTAHATALELVLPWGLQLGTVVRKTELVAKAAKQAFAQELGELPALQRLRKARAAAPKGAAADAGVHTELRLAAKGIAMKFEQHPLEAWMAVHLPLLRTTATQAHLWTHRVLPTMDMRAILGRAYPGGVGPGTKAGYLHAEEVLLREVSRAHVLACAGVRAAQRTGRVDAALLSLTGDAVEAMLVIPPRGEAGRAAAAAKAAAVDPSSAGVPFVQALQLHLDVCASGVGLHFSGTAEPLIGCSSLVVSGPVVVARQQTAPPAQRSLLIDVGQRRRVVVLAAVKGSRPVPKVYTDLQVNMDDACVWYSPGLEPMFAITATCGKRLVPSDPPGLAAPGDPPPPERLPWWDTLRYLWRGRCALKSRGFRFTLGKSLQPSASATTERLELSATLLRATLGPSSTHLHLQADQFAAAAYEETGPNHAAGTLLCVPILEAPVADVILSLTWALPGGRSADNHHVFPMPGKQSIQPPISLASLYRANKLDISLRVQLSRHGGGSYGAGQPAGDPEYNPTIYFGEYQIAFFASLVRLLRGPAATMRASRAKGTFFQKRMPGAASSTSLPRLINLLDISVDSASTDGMHWTPDWHGNDPSQRLLFTATAARYATKLALNQPLPPGMPPPPRRPGAARDRAPRVTLMQLTELRLEALRLYSPGQQPRRSMDGGKLEPQPLPPWAPLLDTVHSGAASFLSEDQPLPARGPLSSGDGGSSSQPVIAEASLALLRRTAADEGSVPRSGSSPGHMMQRKPLTISLEDLRIFMDDASRDALWAFFEHIFSVVLCLNVRRTSLQSAQNMSMHGNANASCATTPTHSRQGSVEASPLDSSHAASLVAGSGSDPGGGPLLALLLAQDEAAGGSWGEDDTSNLGPGTMRSPFARSMASGELHEVATPPHDDGNEACDDEEGRVVGWDLRVQRFEVCFQADPAKGRVLLAAETARVTGTFDYIRGQQITSLKVDEVQAYADKSAFEAQAPVRWLARQEGKLLPPGDTAKLRRVFLPFSLTLRATKTSAMLRQRAAAAQRAAPSPTLRPRSPAIGAGSAAAVSASEELTLKTPLIFAQVDSHEFELLIDVVSTVFLAPPPQVEVLSSEWSLLMESETDEVEALRLMYAVVRQQLVCIQKEAVTIMSTLGVRQSRSVLSHASKTSSVGSESGRAARKAESRGSGKFDRTELLQVVDEGEEEGGGGSVVEDMAAHLLRCMRGQPSVEGIAAGTVQGQKLLVRWADAAVTGAREAVEKGKVDLKDAKAIARKRLAGPKATRISLQADMIAWMLCHDDADKTPFIQAQLTGLTVDNARHTDNSGAFKFIICGLEVRDLSGTVGATASNPEGCLVASWNPDSGWERDDMVRVTAHVGVPTPSHVIYDHVDVLVHPVGVHLTEQVARQLWNYFYPLEDPPPPDPDASKTSKSSKVPRDEGRATAGEQPDSSSSPERAAPGEAGPGASGSAPLLPPPAAGKSERGGAVGALRNLASVTKHRHSRSMEAVGRSVELGLEKSVADARRDLASTCSSKSTKQGSGNNRGSAAVTPRLEPVQLGKHFVHVRFNRAHCCITYTGFPFNVSDFKLVLDSKVFDHFEGTWGAMLSEYSRSLIKSVAKSATGLQRKKIRELLPAPLARPDEGDESSDRHQGKVMTALRNLKGRGESEAPDDALMAAKRRLLLGKQVAKQVKAKGSAALGAAVGAAGSFRGRLVEGARDVKGALKDKGKRSAEGSEGGSSRAASAVDGSEMTSTTGSFP